jgi:hypothetical protein
LTVVPLHLAELPVLDPVPAVAALFLVHPLQQLPLHWQLEDLGSSVSCIFVTPQVVGSQCLHL